MTVTQDTQSPETNGTPAPSVSKYFTSLNKPSEITGDGCRLERAISTSCWVENLAVDNKAARVSFHPLQSTVTYDAEAITPGESIVYIKSRGENAANFLDSSEYTKCTNIGTRAVTSLRAASEIINFISSASLLQYAMYSSRNLIPLFLSTSKHDEFGGRVMKPSMMRKCFSREHAVDSLLEELNKRKNNAARAFVQAIKEKSVVNTALAAWVAGNAANLQHLIQFSKLKYGPHRMYNNAGMFRADASTTSKNRGVTSLEYLNEIKRRHKGTLNLDSAPTIFNKALTRVFSEFKATISSDDSTSGPLASAVRQNRCATVKNNDTANMGMLAPRSKHKVADYVAVERDANLEQVMSKISSDFENLRGSKRKAETDTMQGISVDASSVKSCADLEIDGGDWEWSMHITQLFSQAFLEAMSSLLSCSFGVKNPFSDQGFEAIKELVQKQDGDRSIDMSPSVLADEYLLFTGNFQIPFHVSDPHDIVEGRQVCPNTPILTIVTKKNTEERGIVIDLDLRDRLLIKDELLNKAVAVDDQQADSGTPVLGGCLPIIRGPLICKDRGADDIVNSLANDWYISTGVYYSIGKTSAAICAGYHRAIESTAASNALSSWQNKNEQEKIKKSMRRNADRSARLSVLLGQTVSEWGHQEHISSLDSFWCSSAAVRSKALQDALSRSEIIGVRKQLDGKCGGGEDELEMAEQHIRNTFYRNISNAATCSIEEIANFPDRYSKYSEWFNGEASRKSWEEYAASMAKLSEHERRAFNVKGLFSAINMFRFPLVSSSKRLKPGHKRTNLKAANRIINGLTEMIIQSAFNGTSTGEMSMGLGSAADGWGPANNQLEPSRMKALKLMARFGVKRPDVVSVPINRSCGSISGLNAGITSVDIPVIIISHLISDKKILDDLCREGTDLGKEIANFVQTLSGGNETTASIFTTGKYSIMLLRYIWFNTAIISLTDTNIKMAVDVVRRGLGDALYSDYLSIRSLVSNYNRGLCNFSIKAISEHFLCDKKNESCSNITIDSELQLGKVLQQITDTLCAFTDKKDGTSANSANMENTIKRIGEVRRVQDATVVIKNLSTILSAQHLNHLFLFLFDIGNLNSKIEEPLRRLALGKGLTKNELDNYVHPDITKLFQREMPKDTPNNTPLQSDRTIVIDLNTEAPIIIKANKAYLQERISAILALPDTSQDKKELKHLSDEAALDNLPALKNDIRVPGFLTPTDAIGIVNAFTRDGRFSNKSTHMQIMVSTIYAIAKHLDQNIEEDILSIKVSNMGDLVKKTLLFCLICTHSSAGPILIKHGVKNLSKLLSVMVAETSLSVSRLQSSFYPIPPAVLSLSGMFKFDKNVFDEMNKKYVTEIVKTLTTATSHSMADRCSDRLSSWKLFKAGQNLNRDKTPVAKKEHACISSSLENPISVWSSCALPHFDVAVVPKYQAGITSDQHFRLSTYYQGMHKMSLHPGCKPQNWDSSLAGNMANTFFGLGEISDNSRSFNLALDTIIASPEDICDLVSRESVMSSNDLVHNISSPANVDKIHKLLQQGTSIIKPVSSESGGDATRSNSETSIKEMMSALSKNNKYGFIEGNDTVKEIAKTWNTLSLTNHPGESSTENDVVMAPLLTVPAFRQNVVEATRSVYELAAVCSVMSKDEKARAASRRIMATVENTSPVIQDIGIGRVAGLVSTVASTKQYRKLLQTVSDYRNSLVRLVNVHPFSATTSSTASTENGLKSVYDGMMYAASTKLSSSSSLSDQFWMGVFNECLANNLFADRAFASASPQKIYGSRVNTYAAIRKNINRLEDSMDKDRRDKVKKIMLEIEKYMSELAGDSNTTSLTKLVNAQHMYTKLSDIIGKSVYGDFDEVTCGVMKSTGKKKSARQKSDAILSAILLELASLMYDENQELASNLALAGHIIVAKGVSLELKKLNQIEMYNDLLSVAGVADYAYYSATALCQRLKSEDIKMFLGGTMLQQGLFVTFLLNNVVFSQLSESLKMADLSSSTKDMLVKLMGFCETFANALSVRHARRRINRTQGGASFSSEEAKVDASFVSALYGAYSDLKTRSESETAGKIFDDVRTASKALKSTPPRPKRHSTLTDILEAPSTIHKSFMTSFSEKAAASNQVKRAGGSMLSGNRMLNVYGSSVLNEMRASHSFFTENCEDYFDVFSDDEDERMSISFESSSSSSSSSSPSSGSDLDSDAGYSYDALDHLNASAVPLSAIYGCGGDSDFEDDYQKIENNELSNILRDMGESDEEGDYDDEDNSDTETENTSRRRLERIQYAPGFLSHSFLFNHPTKTRAFLSGRKKFKPLADAYLYDDDGAIFSDEYSDSEDDSIGAHRHVLRRRNAENQCAFISRVVRAFAPTKISLVNGRVSFVTPVGTETLCGFLETYQKSNKKEREELKKKFNIADDKPSEKPSSPRELRRSLIKATAYVNRTQCENAEMFYTAIIGENAQPSDPSVTLADTLLFSGELKKIIEKRNELLKNLTDVSPSLFTTSVNPSSNAMDRARKLANAVSPGYLGVPLNNLSKCLRTKAVDPRDDSNSTGISVNSMLSIKDRSHLDWLTTAAIAFTRSFNVTTFHALDSMLKTTHALEDMYNAFAKLVISQNKEKVHVKSTLLDSIFNTRMSHIESVLGLVCPTAFINHRLPSDPTRREEIESLALNVLRGVNSGQLSSIDIGDVSGLLTFLTSAKFAGHEGKRGGLSLYRMSITDVLSCEPVEKRLKGAVSLEVGKWKMCDNAVFSRRSKRLLDYCSKKFLSLENALGPVARFIPDGSDIKEVGLSKPPTLNVTDDPAMLRLEKAEYGCAASGRFITASAIGNLFGRIDDILNLAKKFVVAEIMFDSATDASSASIEDVAKHIISKMKSRRSKSLKTPFGDTVISQATNFPATSDAIVLRAREMRYSIATIVSDISKKHGITLTFNNDNIMTGTTVSVKTFERMLETAAVLANTKMTLRGIENRLAAAYTKLDQFKNIVNEGMSESKAVICSIAETMNTLEGKNVTDFMKEDGFFRFIVNSELKNIEEAKRHITSAIEGVRQLHAKMLGMLASAANINGNSEEYQRLKNLNESLSRGGTSMLPMTSSCGMFIKHPSTGMWLKTDEECNTTNTINDDHDDRRRRVARSILSIIETNRNKTLRSKLHTMCFGKYSVFDIFVMDDSDVKNVDKLIAELSGQVTSSSSISTNSTAAVSSATAEDASSAPLGKKIPYIPIIFENRQEEKKTSPASDHNKQSDQQAEEYKIALRHLETQEANDLTNILSIATKHKFVSHNQAATVAIFNGNQKAESIIPEAEIKRNSKTTAEESLTSRFPVAASVAIKANSTGTTMQLPPSASQTQSTPVALRLREYAEKVASELDSTQEYKHLEEAERKISIAIKHLTSIQSMNFFTSGVRPEIEQNAMSTLSQSQSAKECAFESFEKVLKQLEIYTPDPSMSTVSLPVNASSSLLDDDKRTTKATDYFTYAYEKLHAENKSDDTLEREVTTKNLVEQEAAIRVPLLLTYPQFASMIRDAVNNFGTYYQLVEEVKNKITNDAQSAISSAFKDTEKEINTDKNSLIPIIDELSQMYSNEADAIKTAIKLLENKKNELEYQNAHTSSIIENITNKIEAGENNVGLNDMLNYGNKADNNQQFLQNLRKFAKDNAGVVFSPSPSTAKNTKSEDSRQLQIKESYRNLLNDAVSTIKAGQEGVVTNYETALDKFPSHSAQYGDLTMQVAEKEQRDRLASVEMFIGVIVDRIFKLKSRLQNSTREATEIENKKREIDGMFRKQMEDRYCDTKKIVGIAEAAAQSALVKDLSQSPLLMAVSGKVDKLLDRVEKIGGGNNEKPSRANKSSDTHVDHISDPTYSCFMSPFHETIKRIAAMYDRDRKGPLNNDKGVPTSEADLQLMSIVDLCMSVIDSTSDGEAPPDMVPSSIIPGLCRLCAMAVTNLHEATHESSHAFNFEGKISRIKQTEMLKAAITGSDNQRVRHDVLAMLEANNGHIKEFEFTYRQKVACLTPVNTLIGSFSGNMSPNTVLVPTSELIHCPGVDYDKFRSIAHRSLDKTVADAPKSSSSIVETLARTAPNAEKLFFPFKDQRRHFNSITDAIISNMNSEASCQLNTTCDQNLVEVDAVTGIPVFVGRNEGKSRLLETKKNPPMTRGGMPGLQRFIDMGTKYMVAPGSLLNANKEETLRLNRLSDINNVRHNGTDVHVAGANSAWRIGEVVKAASTCSQIEADARKLLLLGSVSTICAQKSTQYINDPTAMLNSTFAVQKLVKQAFPSPVSMAIHAGAAESAFATQLAYRHRLFPSSINKNDNYNFSPMEILGMIRRYSDAYTKMYPTESSHCVAPLKKTVSSIPLAATPIGAFEEASSAVKNRISPLSNDYPSSIVNKLSIEAMTDTVVDTLSAVSTLVGRQQQLNRISSCGKAITESTRNTLIEAISKISRDASLISQMNGSSTLSSFLKSSSSLTSVESDEASLAAERILGAVLDGAREANNRLDRLGVGESGGGRPEVGALYRNAMSTILQLNEDEITRDINDIENRLEKRQMREAFNELKKSMLVSTCSSSNCLATPLSVLLSKNNVASGRLAVRNNSDVINAVDEFNTTPLLVRHLMLDAKSPIPLTKEVRGILTQPKAVTARALLSEASPLLAELCLFNTKDTPPERAVDRLVSSAYLVKQAKRFDGVDPLFPAALTGASHLMLSSMDSKYHNSSSFLNNIKLHMNDTTCFLKNIERYEKILGKYGDSYSMSHRQNCNCPFALHHDFRPSVDEDLVSSFAFARPEVSAEEIRDTPYQTNKLLNDKHYVMALSKIDTRITGSALLKKVSEWTEMRMNVSFNGAFEPSRLALSNSGMTTAGVNLDIIVRPNNAKNIMGILECHRDHVCIADAKSTIASSMPAIFQSEKLINASELIQNALPHNRYIQKSTMNAHTIIFTNVLEQLILDLGNVIVNELAGLLASKVPEAVYADTKDMIDSLGSEIIFDSNKNATVTEDHNVPSAPKLVSESMKNAIYQTLMSSKAADPENVPFASSANGILAYDFLLSKEKSSAEKNAERGAAQSVANMPAESTTKLRNHLARIFEAISKQVSDAEFSNILDDIEAKIVDESSQSSSTLISRAIRSEFNKIISFLKILRQNITPALLDQNGKLAEKVAIYLLLLSTKSRLENLLQFGLSNSSSSDLSHLKPVNCSNNTKNIEDTFMYRNVHPILIMALPENFTALLQQEQCDAELAIDNRRSLTTFLNHPNTASIAMGARASLGAGGGNPLGLYISSHVLHESTVTTSDAIVDTDSNLSFHSSITQDPVMVINPFKMSAKLKIAEDKTTLLADKCSYLQVSMPTESSGLVTNTGVKTMTNLGDTFKFTRRDGSPVNLPKVTPSVLCSDASTNLLDNFSRADVTLNDVNIRFGFMPEIISAMASIKGVSTSDIIKEMATRVSGGSHSARSSGSDATVDLKTGDILVKNGTFPDVRCLENLPPTISWGEEDKQKLHAKILPTFLIRNPVASASINGVPVTYEGLLLAEQKRKKAAGISMSSNSESFGSGCIGSGALRAAANSRLMSDLEPLRKGWENVIKLQATFSNVAANLRSAIQRNEITPETTEVTNKLYKNFETLNECRKILQNQTSLLVATSDLVTGGYAGDPSVAMVAPVRPETMGIIGAISAPIRGLAHLLRRSGVDAVNTAIREKLNLSSSNGQLIPEHGVVHKSSNELLTDADSLYRLYSIDENKLANEDANLAKIMAALGLREKDRGNPITTAKYISNLLSSSEYGTERDLAKRQAIVHLLVSNPDLMENVSNSLFFNSGKNAISPLTTAVSDASCATTTGRARGLNNSNNVESLNRLFGSKLCY